jgi:hypothetical protein
MRAGNPAVLQSPSIAESASQESAQEKSPAEFFSGAFFLI